MRCLIYCFILALTLLHLFRSFGHEPSTVIIFNTDLISWENFRSKICAENLNVARRFREQVRLSSYSGPWPAVSWWLSSRSGVGEISSVCSPSKYKALGSDLSLGEDKITKKMTKQINKTVVCWGSSLPFWWPSFLSDLILYWETGIPAWYSIVRYHFHNILPLLTFFLPVLCVSKQGLSVGKSLEIVSYSQGWLLDLSWRSAFKGDSSQNYALTASGTVWVQQSCQSSSDTSNKDAVEHWEEPAVSVDLVILGRERIVGLQRLWNHTGLGLRPVFMSREPLPSGVSEPVYSINCVMGVRSVSWVVRIKWDSWYVVSGDYISTNFMFWSCVW